MAAIEEQARAIGRLIAQTDEYRALRSANENIAQDREAVTLLNRLNALQDRMTDALREGREPSDELAEEFEKLATDLQSRSDYQRVVAAQSNFDRLMTRVNEEIARGIEAGEQSRIILSS